MLIDELVNYCDIQYKVNCPTDNCGYCKQMCSQPKVCPHDCEQCLEQDIVHGLFVQVLN